MTPTQKSAWYSLAVVLLSVGAVLALMPWLGPVRAQGGFGLLGFLGFGALFYRRGPGRIVSDERDDLIRLRSMMVAYSMFWVAFIVVVCLVLPLVYGSRGAVPVVAVQMGVWWGFVLVTGVNALATLLQYGSGRDDAS